jgi:hypothetical protein
MTKELSPLARQLLGNAGHIELFTQKEFDDALALAKAEIMQIAIETTKKALAIEREECAKIVDEMRNKTDTPDAPMMLDITLAQIAEAIRNRMKK